MSSSLSSRGLAACSLALLLLSLASCAQRGRSLSPLVVVPDSSVFHYAPAPREPGAYRVMLTVRLRNRSADTVYLGGPCGAGLRPAQWFLAADSDEETSLNLWGCIGARERAQDAPEPAFFAVPPHSERPDTVWVYARPPVLPPASGVRWSQYAGDFRIAYQRMERRGWPRARWHALAPSRSASAVFRLVAPES